MTHDEFRTRLLVACGLDMDPFVCSPEDAILSVVHHKVTHGDARVGTAQRQVERYRETAEAEHGARLRAEAERDELLAACRAFAAWFDGWCPTQTCCARSGLPIHEQALAAIAKATMESPHVHR